MFFTSIPICSIFSIYSSLLVQKYKLNSIEFQQACGFINIPYGFMFYFCSMEESNRQKKIASVLQSDLANVLQNMLREAGQMGIIISVRKVTVTTDLSIAELYGSIVPADKAQAIVSELNKVKPNIKHQIAQLTKNQLRKMPDLSFYNDDSLEYIDKIDKAVKGTDDPLK